LNQLLEQTADRCVELTGKATAAEDEAEEVEKAAHALTDVALQHAEDLHKDMTEALGAVTGAEQEVDAEAGRADAILDGLPARADATEAKVKALLEAVRHDAAELTALRSKLATRAYESAQEVANAFQELSQRVNAFRQTMETRLGEADAQVQELLEAVEKGQTQMAEEEQHFREAIQSIGVLATDKARALVAALHAVMVQLGRGTVSVRNDASKAHNEAFKAVRTALTDEQPGAAIGEDDTWVFDALQPVKEAVEEFALVPAPARTLIEQSAALISHKAEKALTSLSDVAHLLDKAVPQEGN
jgi:hypothetical protein